MVNSVGNFPRKSPRLGKAIEICSQLCNLSQSKGNEKYLLKINSCRFIHCPNPFGFVCFFTTKHLKAAGCTWRYVRGPTLLCCGGVFRTLQLSFQHPSLKSSAHPQLLFRKCSLHLHGPRGQRVSLS